MPQKRDDANVDIITALQVLADRASPAIISLIDTTVCEFKRLYEIETQTKILLDKKAQDCELSLDHKVCIRLLELIGVD